MMKTKSIKYSLLLTLFIFTITHPGDFNKKKNIEGPEIPKEIKPEKKFSAVVVDKDNSKNKIESLCFDGGSITLTTQDKGSPYIVALEDLESLEVLNFDKEGKILLDIKIAYKESKSTKVLQANPNIQIHGHPEGTTKSIFSRSLSNIKKLTDIFLLQKPQSSLDKKIEELKSQNDNDIDKKDSSSKDAIEADNNVDNEKNTQQQPIQKTEKSTGIFFTVKNKIDSYWKDFKKMLSTLTK